MRDIVDLLSQFFSGISDMKVPAEQDLIDYLVRKGSGIINCQAATFFSVDENRRTLTFRKSIGPVGGDLTGVTFPYGGVVGACAEERKGKLVNDAENSPYFSNKVDKSSGFRTKSVIAVPVIADGKLLGIMEYINSFEGFFNTDDFKAAAIMADYIAVSIAFSNKK
ncbi:MAG: GAF domain-containing protein [Elusimicrobiales bacterium]|nr:GAF domain-containing protein [Elusimicrobiales bacterium]